LLTTAVAGNIDPVGTKVGWIGDNRRTCCASALEVAVDIVDIDEGARRGPSGLGDGSCAELGHFWPNQHDTGTRGELSRPDPAVVVAKSFDLGEAKCVYEER
jgi:hypothetical protein